MNKKDKVALVPKLRFPEFHSTGEWQVTKLNILANKVSIRNKDNTTARVLTNSAVKGVVDQSDYFDREIANQNNLENYFIIDDGDYVYNPRISVSAPVGPISKNKVGQGLMSPLYTVFRFKNSNNDFYEQYFKTNLWHKYLKSISNTGARHDRISISVDNFLKMPLPCHTDKEQQKIADCLSSLDDLITAEDKKLNALKDHKKGLMQKLFPAEGETVPEWRFPEFRGSEEWGKKRMDSLGGFFGGLTGKTKEDFGIGNSEYITYMNVFKNIMCNAEILERVNINKEEKQNKVMYGDLLFTQSSETCEEVGMSSVWVSKNTPYLNSFCMGFRLNNIESYSAEFMGFLMRSNQIRKNITMQGQGVTRVNLASSRLKTIILPIPLLMEQQKIADCLSSLDALITAQAEKIEALKVHKKGLMQGLFPSSEEVGV